jgi:hypothetical protein
MPNFGDVLTKLLNKVHVAMFMQKLVPNVLHDFLKIFEIMGL